MIRRADGWESISSEEFLRRIAGLSSAFVELGVKTGDRVAIFSANRPEWHTADLRSPVRAASACRFISMNRRNG